MSLIANNAIGWANLQISGGWRRICWLCGIIAVGLPLIMFGTLQLGDARDPRAAARALTTWYWMMGAAQGGMLLIGVPSRVFAAIKRDRTSKVIESHRLMPAPAAHAIAGYIVGSNLLLGSAIATVFLLGLFIAVPAQEDWKGWMALHAAGLGVSAMFGCAVAFTSQWAPRLNPAFLVFFVGPLAAARAIIVLPAARVLFAPYFGDGFDALRSGSILPIHVIGFGSQALIAAILFIGACRRYRRDDIPALGFGWGFVLLTTWVALGMIGMRVDDGTALLPSLRVGDVARLAFVVHATLTMLLAIGPIVASAAASLRWRERRMIDPHFIERRPVPLWAAGLCVAAALWAMVICAPTTVGELQPDFFAPSAGVPTTWVPIAMTMAQLALFVLTVAVLARGAVRLRLASAAWLIVPWLVLTWILPPVLDAIIGYVANDLREYPHALSSPSPPICLSCIWSDRRTEAQVGLLTQAALVVLLVVGWTLLKRFNGQRLARVSAAAVAAREQAGE